MMLEKINLLEDFSFSLFLPIKLFRDHPRHEITPKSIRDNRKTNTKKDFDDRKITSKRDQHDIVQRQYQTGTGSAPTMRVTSYFDNHIVFDENRRVMCKYDSTSGQLETNSLYVVCVTDSLLDSDTDKLQFDLNMKINYVDN